MGGGGADGIFSGFIVYITFPSPVSIKTLCNSFKTEALENVVQNFTSLVYNYSILLWLLSNGMLLSLCKIFMDTIKLCI